MDRSSRHGSTSATAAAAKEKVRPTRGQVLPLPGRATRQRRSRKHVSRMIIPANAAASLLPSRDTGALSCCSAIFSTWSVRDHAVMTFAGPDKPGPVYRVSDDDWAIDACPHHGPSLAVTRDGTYHAAWFTSGRVRKAFFMPGPSMVAGASRNPWP